MMDRLSQWKTICLPIKRSVGEAPQFARNGIEQVTLRIMGLAYRLGSPLHWRAQDNLSSQSSESETTALRVSCICSIATRLAS